MPCSSYDKLSQKGARKYYAPARSPRALVGGDTSKLTLHTVQIAEPRAYKPNQIKALRNALDVSQAVFAELLAVSTVLVAQWEGGVRRPAPVVCRLMDKISQDPAGYLSALFRRKGA